MIDRKDLKMPLNIPNVLTVLRILLVPVFAWRYLTAAAPEEFVWAAGILLFSGVTDLTDGIIARATGKVTRWGMAMDPVADKLTQLTVVICLWIRYPRIWPLFVLLMLKELLLLAGGLRLYRRFDQVEAAKWFGKLATVVFYVVMIRVIYQGGVDYASLVPYLVIILVFMAFSWAMYLRAYLRINREHRGTDQKR